MRRPGGHGEAYAMRMVNVVVACSGHVFPRGFSATSPRPFLSAQHASEAGGQLYLSIYAACRQENAAVASKR